MPRQLVFILEEYLSYRGGEDKDYLFCNINGEQMTKSSITSAIRQYNLSRGIHKTSIHAFRHTFAKMAIIDCKIDAFRLQKLLGHADISTTENYVKIFGEDLIDCVEEYNPLNVLMQKRKTIKI